LAYVIHNLNPGFVMAIGDATIEDEAAENHNNNLFRIYWTTRLVTEKLNKK
jgi:hypothetical protein